MRAYEDLAKKAAQKAWDDQFQGMDMSTLPPWTPEELKLIFERGYIAGFKKAREHAKSLVGSFPRSDMQNMAVLVGVIGDARAES